jgi:hypothetical protein
MPQSPLASLAAVTHCTLSELLALQTNQSCMQEMLFDVRRRLGSLEVPSSRVAQVEEAAPVEEAVIAGQGEGGWFEQHQLDRLDLMLQFLPDLAALDSYRDSHKPVFRVHNFDT